MQPNIERAIQEADRVRKEYNPENISPFPYQNVQTKVSDLRIFFSSVDAENMSGAITHDNVNNSYNILINTNKPSVRQHFTIAHELGHYFLHKDKLTAGEWIIDSESNLDGGRTLFRLDDGDRPAVEREANYFAAALIMPEDLVIEAWEKLKSIEDCAKVFNVSVLAMTIRLEKLGLIKE